MRHSFGQPRDFCAQILASLNEAVFVVAPKTRLIQECNPTAETMFKYTREELIGQSVRLLHVDDARYAAFGSALAKALTTQGYYEAEFEMKRRNGEIFLTEHFVRQLYDRGEPTQVVSVVRDITARRRFQESERRQRVLSEALRDTALTLSSTLNLEEVFDRILSNVGRVVPHDAAYILLAEDDQAKIVQHAGDAMFVACEEDTILNISACPLLDRMYRTGEPTLIIDVTSDPELLLQIPEMRAFAGVSLNLRDEIIGFLLLYSRTAGFFVPSHLEHLQSFADHAAIAIENARLHEKVHELAALEERQRLARDLHDAVSQTLFSANMIVEASMSVLQNRPEEVEEHLAQLYKLTRGAMAEMRALLLELRPDALAEAGIEELLQQLVEGIAGRTEIDVFLDIDNTARLPDLLREGVYYIAQEILTNVVKHARATEARICFRYRPDEMRLVIQDDGRGFDIQARQSPALGLELMRERARSFGGTLTVESETNQGTRIVLEWPA